MQINEPNGGYTVKHYKAKIYFASAKFLIRNYMLHFSGTIIVFIFTYSLCNLNKIWELFKVDNF